MTDTQHLEGRLTIRVPLELERAVDQIAACERTSPADVTRRMLRGWHYFETDGLRGGAVW